VKVTAKISTDVRLINAKAHHVAGLLPNHPVFTSSSCWCCSTDAGPQIMFEASFERLHLIGKLPDSVLYKPNVYPAVKYLLRKGEEENCLADLSILFDSLKVLLELRSIFISSQEYDNIHVIVSLIVERPFPDFTAVLLFLRSKPGLVRFINISTERSPSLLVRSLKLKAQRYHAGSLLSARWYHSSSLPFSTGKVSKRALDALDRVAEHIRSPPASPVVSASPLLPPGSPAASSVPLPSSPAGSPAAATLPFSPVSTASMSDEELTHTLAFSGTVDPLELLERLAQQSDGSIALKGMFGTLSACARV
jgi:hypothetical protein